MTQQKLTGKRDFRVKLENIRISKREQKIKKRVQRENKKRKVKKNEIRKETATKKNKHSFNQDGKRIKCSV